MHDFAYLKIRSLIPACLLALGLGTAQTHAADLPDWFEANRVQAHCELFRMQDASAGVPLHPMIAGTGAKVVTLILDNLDEGAWWPSAVGEMHPLAVQRDFAREIIQSVHTNGMKCIGYYRYMSDAWAQKNHPDWVCRDAQGKPVREPRGRHAKRDIFVICANSPYRDFIQTRLCELAERGADMLYFDSWHMPEICTCGFCQKKFEQTTGRKFPLVGKPQAGPKAGEELQDADGKIALGTVYTEDYLQVCRFVSASLIEAFTQWRDAVRKINPAIRFSVGSSLYPMFLSQPHLNADFLAMTDSSKTEFKKEFGGSTAMLKRLKLSGMAAPAFDIQTALGWSLVRDSSDGRPPLMWIPFIKTEDDALRASAAAYSYGCVASLAFKEPAADPARFRSSFANGAKLASALGGARPYGWLAIHVSEQARNRRLNDPARAWREVIAPVLGSFEAAVTEHLPVVTLNDRQLATSIPADTRVLVLASPDELSDPQRAALDPWKLRGGIAVRLKPGEDWQSAAGKAARQAALLQELAARNAKPPIQVRGPASLHAVYFRHPQKGHLAVALVDAWDDYTEEARKPHRPAYRGVKLELDPAWFHAANAVEVLSGAPLSFAGQAPALAQVPDFAINACVLLTPADTRVAQPRK